MIGVDPHKGSHTAAALSAAEERLGELRVGASADQVQRLLAWAAAWPERTWAIEGADGTGHLLARQLLAAGERVLDIQPKLAARVRLLAAGNTNKNDPNDARSVAVAALRWTAVQRTGTAARAGPHPPALMSATLRKSLTIRGLIQTEFATDLTSEFLERSDALGARRVAAAQGRCR